jgi:hypothetical protein
MHPFHRQPQPQQYQQPPQYYSQHRPQPPHQPPPQPLIQSRPASIPVQQQQPSGIPVSAVLEQNQRLENTNKKLVSDFEKHLQEDWKDSRSKIDKVESLNRHVAVLQKIAE